MSHGSESVCVQAEKASLEALLGEREGALTALQAQVTELSAALEGKGEQDRLLEERSRRGVGIWW